MGSAAASANYLEDVFICGPNRRHAAIHVCSALFYSDYQRISSRFISDRNEQKA